MRHDIINASDNIAKFITWMRQVHQTFDNKSIIDDQF